MQHNGHITADLICGRFDEVGQSAVIDNRFCANTITDVGSECIGRWLNTFFIDDAVRWLKTRCWIGSKVPRDTQQRNENEPAANNSTWNKQQHTGETAISNRHQYTGETVISNMLHYTGATFCLLLNGTSALFRLLVPHRWDGNKKIQYYTGETLTAMNNRIQHQNYTTYQHNNYSLYPVTFSPSRWDSSNIVG